MDQKIVVQNHWWAIREVMHIIRRKYNSPETRRLVEQRNARSRSATLRRRYDHQTQRTIFALSRPNKRSRQEIAEIDAELSGERIPFEADTIR